MNKRKLQIIGAALVVASLLGLVGIPRNIQVTINGESQNLITNALTVSAALEKDGFVLGKEDQITPDESSLLFGVNEVNIELARPVEIILQPENEIISIITSQRSPALILEEAGIDLEENDRLLMDGEPITLEAELPYEGDYKLVVRRAVKLTIEDNGEETTLTTSQDTLGKALEDANIILDEGDRVEPALDTVLTEDLYVRILRANLITIQTKDEIIKVKSAAEIVGEILSEAGLGLQGADYSVPDSSQPVPDNGIIQVVHVREEILLTQTNIPFEVEFIQSDEVELDKRDVVQPGEFGVEVTRTRIIYEDDKEVNRIEEVTWVAKDPVDQLTGLGTKVVVRTMDTPNGPIEYWRAVNVYATSYSPCRSGTDRCYYGTSSGLPAAYGAIGVTRAWYNLMVGQRLYVPGYGIGTIADIGGGVPGQYWIDLAYSDDDYVAWHHNVTVYFLTPVPDNIPWILP